MVNSLVGLHTVQGRYSDNMITVFTEFRDTRFRIKGLDIYKLLQQCEFEAVRKRKYVYLTNPKLIKKREKK
jgi:hypothetical protein